MLSSTELEFKTADVLNQDYEQYLLEGGRFPYEDFKYITNILAESNTTPLNVDKSPCTCQITGICELCDIEPSLKEIYIYKELRRKMNPDIPTLNSPNVVNPWQMNDAELVREIFLITDPTQHKYQTVGEIFPHMFGL
ncbi:MAG: hypothetical protein XD87_0473 [candidate division WS6 bacterium 36_33]|uniref:Uncharacterized protein n=1 Tax=candidate division WS6 bacterium 36_33 TaxID=1641388 RepID=A0A117LTN0_9BACT|nr:MAG: hypothetical protein XD87_0473 [candidate division WS6 bacterium 36_33]